MGWYRALLPFGATMKPESQAPDSEAAVNLPERIKRWANGHIVFSLVSESYAARLLQSPMGGDEGRAAAHPPFYTSKDAF